MWGASSHSASLPHLSVQGCVSSRPTPPHPRWKEHGLGQRSQRAGMEAEPSLLGQMGPLCPLPSPGNPSLAFCPSWNS